MMEQINLGEEAAQELLRYQKINLILVPVAVIAIALAVIAYLLVDYMRRRHDQSHKIAALEIRLEAMQRSNKELYRQSCTAAEEHTDIVADCEWRIAQVEQEAKKQIAEARKMCVDAQGREQQARSRARQIAGERDRAIKETNNVKIDEQSIG